MLYKGGQQCRSNTMQHRADKVKRVKTHIFLLKAVISLDALMIRSLRS